MHVWAIRTRLVVDPGPWTWNRSIRAHVNGATCRCVIRTVIGPALISKWAKLRAALSSGSVAFLFVVSIGREKNLVTQCFQKYSTPSMPRLQYEGLSECVRKEFEGLHHPLTSGTNSPTTTSCRRGSIVEDEGRRLGSRSGRTDRTRRSISVRSMWAPCVTAPHALSWTDTLPAILLLCPLEFSHSSLEQSSMCYVPLTLCQLGVKWRSTSVDSAVANNWRAWIIPTFLWSFQAWV